VRQVLEKAEAQGLDTISITDHNSVATYLNELKDPETRKLFSGKIIPGVELLYEHDGIVNEVLGYGIDPEELAKVDFLQEGEKQRREIEYLGNLHARYTELGYNLKNLQEMKTELVETNDLARNVAFKDIWSEENTKVSESYEIYNRDDFDKFYWNNVESPKGKNHAYQQFESLETNSKAIRDAGGKVFMAHVFRANRENRKSDTLEPEVSEMLLHAARNNLIDGIEVEHSSFSENQSEFLKKFCEENNLLMSGGSDSHAMINKKGEEDKLAQVDTSMMPWTENARTVPSWQLLERWKQNAKDGIGQGDEGPRAHNTTDLTKQH
jgi:predicted metal-dependent phosphoesterase TrpH